MTQLRVVLDTNVFISGRGYEDHCWWRTLTVGGVYFVIETSGSG